MVDDNHPDEDEVLRRMLNTPHTPHKPLGHGQVKKVPKKSRGKLNG